MPKKATMSNSKSCDHSDKKKCVCGGHSNKTKKSRKKDHRTNNYIETIQL